MESSRIRFERTSEYDLIVIPAIIRLPAFSMKVRMAVDTGASHSVLDANCFWMRGMDFTTRTATQAKGIGGMVNGFEIQVESIMLQSIIRNGITLFVYDFMQAGLAEHYDGLLGLDFLSQAHFCIDSLQRHIEIRI